MPSLQDNLTAILKNRKSSRQGKGKFHEEGPEKYLAALAQNLPFATKGPYNTSLAPAEEAAFRKWVLTNKIPFDPDEKTSDYDMRGYWKALQNGGEGQGVNKHFPDTFKTPADTTFSAESKYANKAPFIWDGNSLIDLRTGKAIFK